jgi:EAL domain-containing protein (putative c-di-GMP-specific phosphodiesterase class I)
MGSRVAIDDFGTGFSSLSYLERLPIDAIKIDISFVQRIKSRDDRFPILGGIIAIASEIGLEIIAEGVENQVQSDFLRAHGCDMAQGFLFSRPIDEEALEGLILQSV